MTNWKRPARRRTLQLATAPAVTAALLVSGCSAGSSGDDARAVGVDDLITSLPEATGAIDTLNWNLPGEPETLDPAQTVTYSSGPVVHTLCDSLTSTQPDLSYEPNLGTPEVVSPTSIVYTIRDDATFWDGSPVTAEDVAYSLTRTAQPQNALSYIFINMESAVATGPNQVTVTFTQPDELFLSEMSIVGIVQKAYTEAAGDSLGTPTGGLMCSGPYELGEWSPGNTLTMTRNDAYWNTDLTPHAATVRFSFITDATALTQALDAGEIDGAYEIPASAVPSLRESSTGTLSFGPSTQGTNITRTRPDGPLDNQDVRTALQKALDRESIADVIYHGAATANYTTITPATWPPAQADVYQAAYDTIAADRAFDIDAATQLVEDSGYDGTPIVLGIQAGDETASQVAQLVQQQASTIGLTVEISSLQPLAYSQAGYDPSFRTGLDLILQSSFNGVSDPLEPVGFFLLPGQPYNYTNYDDQTTTDLIDQARSSFDADERADLFVQIQGRFEPLDDSIPIVSTNTTSFLNGKYSGAITSFAYWSMPSFAFIGAK